MNLTRLEWLVLAAVLLVAGGGILVALNALGVDIPLLSERAPRAEPLLGDGSDTPPDLPDDLAADGLLAELGAGEETPWLDGPGLGGAAPGVEGGTEGGGIPGAGGPGGAEGGGAEKGKRDPLVDEMKAKTDLEDPGQLLAFLIATFTPKGTKLGPEDLEFLFEALAAQEDWGVRNLLFAHLERIGGGDVTAGVLEFLKNEKDPAALARALGVLRAQNDPAAVEGLVAFLSGTDNRRLREVAFQNLLKTKSAAATDSLLEVLDHAQDPQLRRYALAALSQLGGEQGAQAVVSFAASSDPYERAIGQKSMRDLRDPAAVPVLTSALATSGDPSFRVQVVRSLGRIRDVSAVEPVSQVALFDQSRSVRMEAIRTLTSIGSGTAYPALTTLSETDPNKTIRKAAARAIQVIERKEAQRAARNR